MDITELQVRRVKFDEKKRLVGFASFVIDGAYYINDVLVMQDSKNEYFMRFPRNAHNSMVHHPIKRDINDMLLSMVVQKVSEQDNAVGDINAN